MTTWPSLIPLRCPKVTPPSTYRSGIAALTRRAAITVAEQRLDRPHPHTTRVETVHGRRFPGLQASGRGRSLEPAARGAEPSAGGPVRQRRHVADLRSPAEGGAGPLL